MLKEFLIFFVITIIINILNNYITRFIYSIYFRYRIINLLMLWIVNTISVIIILKIVNRIIRP